MLTVPGFFADLIGFNFTPPSLFVINDNSDQYPILSLFFASIVYLLFLYTPVSIFVFLMRKLKLRKLYIFIISFVLIFLVAGGLYLIKEVPGFSPSQAIFSKPTMTIYLKTDATEMQAKSLMNAIKQISGVNKVTYISQQDVFSIYKQQNKDNPLLISISSPSDFNASINVYINFSYVGDAVIHLAKNQSFVAQIADFRK